MDFSQTLSLLRQQGNFRAIPDTDSRTDLVDLSSNDYLGIADDSALLSRFIASLESSPIRFTSSAARLLSGQQTHHRQLENLLADIYNRHVLLMNSGYHANVGAISSLASDGTLILADKLVHASIIDGIMLSRAKFERFRHNDMAHLRKLLDSKAANHERVLIITESVFSMDGDQAPLEQLAQIRREYANTLLYVDEAHAFGVLGPQGMGLCRDMPEADIVIGTLGKAAASTGAFIAVNSRPLLDFLVNKARSFIFSTAMPPVNCAWSSTVVRHILTLDDSRRRLEQLSQRLASVLQQFTDIKITPSHIQPLIVGSAERAMSLSEKLAARGFKVLPIRTPTVPPGTERLRFSLSASIPEQAIDKLGRALAEIMI